METPQISSKWGIPDWKDPLAYPNHKNKVDKIWKWEFLRRDSNYRKDWDKHRHSGHPFQLAVLEEDDSKPISNEDYDFYPEQHPDLWGEIRRLLCTYGLPRLHCPALSFPKHLNFYVVPKDEILIPIDLSRPIQQQLDHFRLYLKQHQKTNQKKEKRYREPDRKTWPLLLRILDAKDAGLTLKEIFHNVLKLSIPKKHKGDDQYLISHAGKKYNAAREMWQKITVPQNLHPSFHLVLEDDLVNSYPLHVNPTRRTIPFLYS